MSISHSESSIKVSDLYRHFIAQPIVGMFLLWICMSSWDKNFDFIHAYLFQSYRYAAESQIKTTSDPEIFSVVQCVDSTAYNDEGDRNGLPCKLYHRVDIDVRDTGYYWYFLISFYILSSSIMGAISVGICKLSKSGCFHKLLKRALPF